MLSIVVAIDQNNAIGHQGDLLCHMSSDLQHFKALTTGHTILMGRRTYFSFPRRPLPNRRHIVLTSDLNFKEDGVLVAHNIDDAKALLNPEEETFVIGGGTVYQEWLPLVERLYVTYIDHAFTDADTYFPAISSQDWKLIEQEHHARDERNPYNYSYMTYARVR